MFVYGSYLPIVKVPYFETSDDRRHGDSPTTVFLEIVKMCGPLKVAFIYQCQNFVHAKYAYFWSLAPKTGVNYGIVRRTAIDTPPLADHLLVRIRCNA